MRSVLTTFFNALMTAEADAVCGAGARSQDRKNSRNCYRHRHFDTRTATLDPAMVVNDDPDQWPVPLSLIPVVLLAEAGKPDAATDGERKPSRQICRKKFRH